MMDEQYWGDPEQFRPDRFITHEGKIRNYDRMIPFGKGELILCPAIFGNIKYYGPMINLKIELYFFGEVEQLANYCRHNFNH